MLNKKLPADEFLHIFRPVIYVWRMYKNRQAGKPADFKTLKISFVLDLI
jgi:hypothetical protein